MVTGRSGVEELYEAVNVLQERVSDLEERAGIDPLAEPEPEPFDFWKERALNAERALRLVGADSRTVTDALARAQAIADRQFAEGRTS